MMDAREYEKALSRGDLGSRRLKAQSFEKEMDRLNDGIRKASSESELAEKIKFKQYVLAKYNKYNWKEFKS